MRKIMTFIIIINHRHSAVRLFSDVNPALEERAG